MTAVIGEAAELLDRSDERDAQLELRHRAYAEGYGAGRQAEGSERDALWNRIARQAHAHGTPYAEIERRRWVVRGEQRTRGTFSQPHPGDFQGRDGAM
jgi:hypothetical protein